MAKFQKKVKPQETPIPTAPVPVVEPAPEKVSLGEDMLHESGLPLPEGVQPVKEEKSTISVAKEVVPVPPVIGVSDESPTAVEERKPEGIPPRPSSPPSSSSMELVKVRAMRDLDYPPEIGQFSFADAIGKECRTGQIIRGRFKNGYIYVVPSYVANVLTEKNWGMRI